MRGGAPRRTAATRRCTHISRGGHDFSLEPRIPRLPSDDGHDLPLCEIFERGLVNEIWIAAEAGVRNVYENQSYVQMYGFTGGRLSI
jgi:hypothetical protein